MENIVSQYDSVSNLFNIHIDKVKLKRAKLDTVLLYTSMEYQFVSSTLIKEVAKYGGDVSEFVSEHVANAIKMKYATIN